MSLDVETLRSSLALVMSREPLVCRRFFEIRFERHPIVRPLFSRYSAREQEQLLRDAIVAVVDHLEDAPWLAANLAALGQRHVRYGVTREMYDWVGACMLATLAEVAGRDWTPPLEIAWAKAYRSIVALMLPEADGAPPR